MRTALILLGVAATLAAGPAAAQTSGGGRGAAGRAAPPTNLGRERQAAIRERIRNATPEERAAMRDHARERRDAMTPEQREVLRARGSMAAGRARPEPSAAQKEFNRVLREKRQALRADVAAGKLDRKTAAEELRAWMKANRPKPGGEE